VYKTFDLWILKEKMKVMGHIIRMHGTREAKKYFENKPKGKRKVGRPRLNRLGSVENDLRELKAKRWGKRQTIEKNVHLS
jgi:hypothetical protein